VQFRKSKTKCTVYFGDRITPNTNRAFPHEKYEERKIQRKNKTTHITTTNKQTNKQTTNTKQTKRNKETDKKKPLKRSHTY
jgi:hypothetical protein